MVAHSVDECVAVAGIHNDLAPSGIDLSERGSWFHRVDRGGLGAEHQVIEFALTRGECSRNRQRPGDVG